MLSINVWLIFAWRTQIIPLLHAHERRHCSLAHLNYFTYLYCLFTQLLSAFSISRIFLHFDAFFVFFSTSFLIIPHCNSMMKTNERMIIVRCAYRSSTCAMKFASGKVQIALRKHKQEKWRVKLKCRETFEFLLTSWLLLCFSFRFLVCYGFFKNKKKNSHRP